MAFSEGILDEQHIAGSDNPLFAITHFDFRLAGEKQDKLALRCRVPIPQRRHIALRASFFECQTMSVDHPREIGVDAVLDTRFFKFIEMRFAVFTGVYANDFHQLFLINTSDSFE